MQIETKITAQVSVKAVLKDDGAVSASVSVGVPYTFDGAGNPERSAFETSRPGEVSEATLAELKTVLEKVQAEALAPTVRRAQLAAGRASEHAIRMGETK